MTEEGIDALGLSKRAYNCLVRGGFTTVEEVERTPDWELLRIPDLGRISFREIRRATSRLRREPDPDLRALDAAAERAVEKALKHLFKTWLYDDRGPDR